MCGSTFMAGLKICFQLIWDFLSVSTSTGIEAKLFSKIFIGKKLYICLLSVCRHIMSCATNIAHFIHAIHSPFHTAACFMSCLFIYVNNTVLQVHLIVTRKLIELYPR